jgi:hypothetical protein
MLIFPSSSDEAEQGRVLLGGSQSRDRGRGLPSQIDGETGAARSGNILEHNLRIDFAAPVTQMLEPGEGKLQRSIAMDEAGFTIVNHAQGLPDIDGESRPGRALTLAFKRPSAAALITTGTCDAPLVKKAGRTGISEKTRRDQRGLMQSINRDELLRHTSPHIESCNREW